VLAGSLFIVHSRAWVHGFNEHVVIINELYAVIMLHNLMLPCCHFYVRCRYFLFVDSVYEYFVA
jgi:hypothetical protein